MSNKMTKLSLNIRKTKIVEQALNFWNDEKIQTAAQTKKCHQATSPSKQRRRRAVHMVVPAPTEVIDAGIINKTKCY